MGGSRYIERGFQDIGFPRCTIIIQDLKDYKNCFSKMYHNHSRSQRFQNFISQDLLRFQKRIFPKCRKIERFIQNYQKRSKTYPNVFNICEIYWDLLRFQDHQRFKISMILLRSQDVDSRFVFKPLLTPIVFEPRQNLHFNCFDPNLPTFYFVISENLRYLKIICFEWCGICSCIF